MPKIKKNYIDEIKRLDKLKKIKLIESEAFGGARDRFVFSNSNQASHDINLRDKEIIQKVQNLFFNISENNVTEKNTQEFLYEFQDFELLWKSNAIPNQIKNALKQNIKIITNESGGKSGVIEFQENDFFKLSGNNIFFREIHNPIKTLCIISLFPDISSQITGIYPNYNIEEFKNNIANTISRYIEPSNFNNVKFIDVADSIGINDSEIIKKLSEFPSLETLRIDGYYSDKQNSSVRLDKLKTAFNKNKSRFFKKLKAINIGGNIPATESKEIILFLYQNIPTLTNIISNNLTSRHITTHSIFKDINQYNNLKNIERIIKINDQLEGEYPVTEFTKLVLDDESIDQLQYYNRGISIENIVLDSDVESDLIYELINQIQSHHIVDVKTITGIDLENLTIEDVKEIKDTLKNIDIDITLKNINPIVYNAIIKKYLQFNHNNFEEFIDDMAEVFDQIEGQNKIFIDLSQLSQYRIDVSGVNILKDVFEKHADNIAAVMLPDKIFIRIDALKSAFKELIELLKSKHIAVHPDNY